MLVIGNRILAGHSAMRAFLVVTIFFLAQGSASLLQAQGPQDYIVTYRDGTIPAVRAVSVGNAGAVLRFNYSFVNGAAVTVPNENALEALRNDPSVLSIIPDRPVFALQRAQKKPDNPGGGGGNGGGGGGKQTEVIPAGVTRVGVPTSGSDGAGIGVAIMDTGIDFLHQDLAPAAEGFDGFGGNCQDDHGHGTHVAGIVAAIEGNALDVVGVAPNATLHCVKVLD